MSEKRREYNRKYNREWKLNHPKECKEQKKRYREKHTYEIKEREKKYRHGLKTQCLIHYGGNPPRCVCCDETHIEFLTIDHINGGGNKHRRELFGVKVGGWHFNLWLIKNNFPEGYQIMCFNCNCGRVQNNGVCPHKSFSTITKTITIL